jgi:hypothetical protein
VELAPLFHRSTAAASWPHSKRFARWPGARFHWRVMESLDLQRVDAHWGHELAIGRSADSLVRESVELGSRRQSCPRSGPRFMESRHEVPFPYRSHEWQLADRKMRAEKERNLLSQLFMSAFRFMRNGNFPNEPCHGRALCYGIVL